MKKMQEILFERDAMCAPIGPGRLTNVMGMRSKNRSM